MTIVTPDPSRARRTVGSHTYTTPVVRELPAQQTLGLAPGSTW
jgi:hypothetical protein